MAKEFFKNAGDAFKFLFNETVEAGKRFAESEPVQKVAAEVKEQVQEFKTSEFGTKLHDTVEKVGDELAHQVKKLYKVCPTCGRKMASGDNYCASCGTPLPTEPTIWDEPETVEPVEVVTEEPAAEDADFVEAPVAAEEVVEAEETAEP